MKNSSKEKKKLHNEIIKYGREIGIDPYEYKCISLKVTNGTRVQVTYTFS